MATELFTALMERFKHYRESITNSTCDAIKKNYEDDKKEHFYEEWTTASLNGKPFYINPGSIKVEEFVNSYKPAVIELFNSRYSDCKLIDINVVSNGYKMPQTLHYTIQEYPTPCSEVEITSECEEEIEELVQKFKNECEKVSHRDPSEWGDFGLTFFYTIKNSSLAPLILRKALERISEYLFIPQLDIYGQYRRGQVSVHFQSV